MAELNTDLEKYGWLIDQLIDDNIISSEYVFTDFKPFPNCERKILIVGLIHCADGPVGLSSYYNYGGVGLTNVRSLFLTLTTSGWKDFLKRIKSYLELENIYLPCIMMEKWRRYFPNQCVR